MDTNVAVVANGEHPEADLDCVQACIDSLIEIRERYCVLMDDLHLIWEEYRRRLRPSGQPGPGDAFFKWLWDNQGNERHCRHVTITPDVTRDFGEFPEDPALERFDRKDRKFVAVVLASGERPPVLNAVDTDWWEYRAALKAHGVTVRFLCPQNMRDR